MDVLTPAPSQLSLPIDVVKEIIDRLHLDQRTLRSFTLTCRELLICSRMHLFRTVKVESWSSLKALSEFLDSSPILRRTVCAVRFGEGRTSPQDLFGSIPLQVFAQFPAACEWYWDGAPWNPSGSRSVSIHRTVLRVLWGHSVVETLHVQSIRFTSYSDLVQLLCALPHLRYLKCRSLNFKKDIKNSRNPQRGKPLRLSTLSVVKLDDTLFSLLLDLTKDTLEHLIVGEEYPDNSTWHGVNLSALKSLLSLTLRLASRPAYDHGNIQALRLLSSTQAMFLKDLSIQLLPDLLSDFPTRLPDGLRQLDGMLRGRPLETCAFGFLGAKKNTEDRWRDEARRICPALHAQTGTRVTVECLNNDGRKTTAVGHREMVLSLAVSPNGVFAATCSEDGSIILWDIQQRRIVHEWDTGGSVQFVAFSPDGHRLASGGPDETVTVWDTDRFTKLATLTGHTRGIRRCAWSPDGTKLASVAADHDIRVWDARTYKQLYSFTTARTTHPTLHFSPDGRWLLGGCRLYLTSTPDVEHLTCGYGASDYRRHGYGYVVLDTAAFDPTGERVAIAHGGEVRIWNIQSGQELVALHGHRKDVTNISFSPDGTQLMSASEDRTVKIWSSYTGAMLFALEGHRGEVSTAGFSPDGKHVASASQDRTVRVWRTCDGSCVWTFRDHGSCVSHVAFSLDGQFLVSGARDGSVCIRPLRHFIAGWNKY